MNFTVEGVAMAAGLCLAVSASAQLIGPIPPATVPTPEYVAPEKREVPVVAVPEVEPPAPTIIEKDDKGRIKALGGTAEEGAVAAYVMDAARRERVVSVGAARKLDLDRFVVQNLDKVLAARKMRERVENASEFNDLFAARDVVVALRFERLIDRLERARAITPAQRVRLDETLLSYDKARKQQIDADAGNDPTRAAILNLRQTFADATREVFESLDRQMDDFIENYEATRGTLHLTDNQRATLDRDHALFVMGSPGKPSAERMVVLRKVFIDGFDLELQRAALTARLAGRAPQTGK